MKKQCMKFMMMHYIRRQFFQVQPKKFEGQPFVCAIKNFWKTSFNEILVCLKFPIAYVKELKSSTLWKFGEKKSF